MVPRTVLTRSGPISLNTARPVNTVQPRTTVNNAGPMKNVINNAYSTARRPFNKITAANNSNFTKKVNIVKGTRVNTARPKAVLSAVKGNKENAVKASACWVWRPKHKVLDHGNPQQDLKNKGVIDSGCSRHMTRNRSYLTDYEEIDRGFVAFGGNSKGGKITGKDFKLTDESHVLLKVPRKDNMYSVDLKNVVPQGGLTCLFAKATPDESNLWHRRLGHVNFKTMNKLVRRNLVRGLPSKLFEINQTCVACQKRKQHRASCKTKIVSSISQPLQMLHMDLFGLTFIKSLIKKMYCLVVTDDLIDLKVKVIRCDNGTEFKNRVMNQFCEMNGIKREFSVARTPQQNGVAERKNKTLIEAARTMLADSKLSITFWAEAVNTVCYVQNRVLVIKPHNNTPYELFLGRKPALSFIRPFGCPVTILNTIDHLGKFNGKADEGFFVGYSTNSKAFRVFNSRTRIVEEKLHVQFSENTYNITGSRPNWLFDIDALTNSMNYKLVVAGNQSNGNAGIKACDNAGKARIETVPCKDYILLPMEEEKIDTKDLGNENEASGKDSEVPKEGIDYDEVLSPVARIESIRLFLAYASFKDFVVYQMDVESAFLYGKIEEEVYVCQPIGFEDPDFPERVYKVGKCTYGGIKLLELDDIIFGSTKKSLCTEFEKMMHKKFQISSMGELTLFLGLCRLISWQCKKRTVVTNSITKAEYIAASNCCGQKGIGVNAGDSKLMLLGINLLLLEKVNVARHNLLLLVLKVNAARHNLQLLVNVNAVEGSFINTPIKVAFLTKSAESEGFKQIVDFLNASSIKYALTVNPTIYTSCVEQFWSTAKAKTVNGEVQLQALVDGKKIVVTKASVRRDLQLEDANGVDCLPNAIIFE
ncbi:putative ribonuclease H-like domain-containing protein [Tanacetum coccineum]